MLNSMIKANSSMNTTIPGMIGYKEIKDSNKKNQNQEFLWLLKG
jgi:hypothetical protein